MGTRWRGLLAPVNQSTDDGRRFLTFTYRTLPLGLKWQRNDEPGHETSIVVGSLDEVNIGTAAEAVQNGWVPESLAAESKMPPDAQGVWGAGDLFDDVDPEVMPRLAEDVAEVKRLLDAGVIAPSVDPIPVGSIWLVKPGSDEPIGMDELDEMFWESMETGDEPELEVLFEEGLIAAATLVVTPAFSEVRPFEMVQADTVAAVSTEKALALTAAAPVAPADLFAVPEPAAYQELTVVRRPDGLLAVSGHLAGRDVCHLEFRGTCVTAPASQSQYVPFHRYVIDTTDGIAAVGRLTTGYGRAGNSCPGQPACRSCRGKDDHACTTLGLAATIGHYDHLTTLAWVRAVDGEHGIWLSGVIDDALTEAGERVLDRRKVSGDWRDVGGNLELVEALALAVGEPGFPTPRSYMRRGRQTSLVAAFAPPEKRPAHVGRVAGWDAAKLAQQVAAELAKIGVTLPAQVAPEPALTAADAAQTGAMVALRMTEEDAQRLAVQGGEPADELHLTLLYLGTAADIDADTQAAIIEALTSMVGDIEADAGTAQVVGDVFGVSVLNSETDERDTAVVLNVGGDMLTAAHDAVVANVANVYTAPPQLDPWLAHITLAYADGTDVEALAEGRTGPVTFDRLRVAFAGDATDIDLSGSVEAASATTEAAALYADVDAALDLLDQDDRAAQAALLLAEIDEEVPAGV